MGITRFRGGTKPDILAKLMAAHVPEDDPRHDLNNDTAHYCLTQLLCRQKYMGAEGK